MIKYPFYLAVAWMVIGQLCSPAYGEKTLVADPTFISEEELTKLMHTQKPAPSSLLPAPPLSQDILSVPMNNTTAKTSFSKDTVTPPADISIPLTAQPVDTPKAGPASSSPPPPQGAAAGVLIPQKAPALPQAVSPPASASLPAPPTATVKQPSQEANHLPVEPKKEVTNTPSKALPVVLSPATPSPPATDAVKQPSKAEKPQTAKAVTPQPAEPKKDVKNSPAAPEEDLPDKLPKGEDKKSPTAKKMANRLLPQLLTWKGSLLFQADQLQALYDALRIAEQGSGASLVPGKTLEGKPAATSQQAEIHQSIAPTFYLNSIMFISSEDWAIWINGRKLSYEGVKSSTERIPSLKIVKVTPQQVHLVWKSSFLNELAPDWEKILKEDEEGTFVSSDYDISVDKDENSVYFVLRPNQRFVLRNMQVLEGNQRQEAANSTP